jgi:hypothetical protein
VRLLASGRNPIAGSRRQGVLLIDALIILIAAAAVTPPDWRHVLGLLTALLLVPWILLLHTGRPNQD